jgi:cytochrome bd-type quinol oxidase subunit 2
MNDFYEPASRRAEIFAGIAALAAGIFAIGFAIWLPFQDRGRSPERFVEGLAVFTAALGCYCLVLARRLLAQRRPRHLVSPFVLVLVALIMLGGAVVGVIFVPGWGLRSIEGVVIAVGCLGLAWRRREEAESAVPPPEDAA